MLEVAPITREEISRIQRKLAYVTAYELPIPASYGIELIQCASELPDDMECTRYIFGMDSTEKEVADYINFMPNKANPQAGDIAVYLRCDTQEIIHVGKVVRDGYVISKWGYGDVLIHPLFFIPYVAKTVVYKPALAVAQLMFSSAA
jgi:hypothetical protein